METINRKNTTDSVRLDMAKTSLIYQRILDEQSQGHSLRKGLYKKIGKLLGCPVIAYYTNFDSPAILDDADVDMLGEILRDGDFSKGVALIINSPGGDIVAAERMVMNFRLYSGTGSYLTVVPKMAMSAGTEVCLGSEKIIMGASSSLGPIYPQITEYDPVTKATERFSILNIINSYKKIFEEAKKTRKSQLEPYLQALDAYDPKKIEEYISYVELSEDVAIRTLKTGMFRGQPDTDIENKIQLFLTPEKTIIHDRPIYAPEIRDAGFNVEIHDVKDPLWKVVSELHVRLEQSLIGYANVIETKDYSFFRPIKKEEEE